MSRKVMLVIAVVLLLGISLWAVAQQAPAAKKAKGEAKEGKIKGPLAAQQVSAAPDVVTTIVYDPGTPADALYGTAQAGPSGCVGNQFNSDSGFALLATGTIDQFTFYPVANGSVSISVYGPPTTGGAAPAIGIWGASGVVNSVFNAAGLATPTNVGSSFLVGLYVGAFGGSDQIGIRNATTNGQGYHGMQINWGATSGTGFADLGSTNVMIRVHGDLRVPVELMSFSID
ncbi:MAG: hypothetical protein GY856_24815 [bacterium]|nr:hypothetical protein [bacterium]